MTQQLTRIAAKAYAENHIVALSGDLQLWRASNSGLPESSLFHELAELCAGYASEGDEYQEAERLVVLKALEAVGKIEPLATALGVAEKACDRAMACMIRWRSGKPFDPDGPEAAIMAQLYDVIRPGAREGTQKLHALLDAASSVELSGKPHDSQDDSGKCSTLMD